MNGLSSIGQRGPVEIFPGHVLLPTGGKWAFVHHSGHGGLDDLPPMMGNAPCGFHATVNAALDACRSGRGDYVLVLPGHAETLSAADSWSNIKAGTKVVGLGWGDMRPKFHWSVAASTVLVDVANFGIENCILNLAGDPTLTTAITGAAAGSILVSARGFSLQRCEVNVGVDANQVITVGIMTTDGGDMMDIGYNRFWSGALTAAGAFEDGGTDVLGAEIPATGSVIQLIGSDLTKIHHNYMAAGMATDTDGLIETITTASKLIEISDNFIWAGGAGNTCAVDMGTALKNTGVMLRNILAVEADGTAETVAFTRHADVSMVLLDNFMVHTAIAATASERGLVIGTASA